MKFKPCIDIHNGKVKQIVGGTLSGKDGSAKENYVSEKGADFYASLYKSQKLSGGHIIMLGPGNREQALKALKTYPGGMQIGGGITPDNAEEYLQEGASHVIVTSYVFREGIIDYKRLKELSSRIGKENLVLDLSCRKNRDGRYYVVTDRWQNFTETVVDTAILKKLSGYCDEFLVHAVDAEGKQAGIETEVLKIISGESGIPVTYAGGIRDLADIEIIEKIGGGVVDFTVGSALDLFGGKLPFRLLAEKYGPEEKV